MRKPDLDHKRSLPPPRLVQVGNEPKSVRLYPEAFLFKFAATKAYLELPPPPPPHNPRRHRWCAHVRLKQYQSTESIATVLIPCQKLVVGLWLLPCRRRTSADLISAAHL